MLNPIILFVTPLLSSLILFICPRNFEKGIKQLALLLSLIPLTLLIYGGSSWIGTETTYRWIPQLSINFDLRIDSLSFLFLCLTTFIIPISLFGTNNTTVPHANLFYGLILLVEALLIGFFMARDLAVFTVFYEGMLIPLFFIINLWGGEKRTEASIKFIVYLLAGSALMVAAVLGLYFLSSSEMGEGTFNLDLLAKLPESMKYLSFICGIFLLAFAVKTPLFPFHAWLPDAYTQAPTTGSILLSALLSKAGIYGIIRINLTLFPTFMQAWNPLLLGLAIAGVFYGAFAAWMQNDFKRLIAYSSFSHVNFVLAGLFVWNSLSHEGAVLQALNHGITIAALFLVAGWLQQRIGNTSLYTNSGLATYMPYLCWFTLFFVLSSVALPGTNNFIGEIMILLGLFIFNPWISSLLALSIIFSVVYMLRWMQKVYFQSPNRSNESFSDINNTEIALLIPLIAVILWIGFYPAPILKQVEHATDRLKTQEAS